MFAEGALVNRKYRVLAELGQGGLGLSYKALLLGTNGLCVIKVLDRALVPSLIPADCVEQAVRKSSELHHPAIIRWQSAESGSEGETILVREFVEGLSLKGVLTGEKAFSVQRATRIIRQLAMALDAAHRMKMIHGDLRPENMLLDGSDSDEKVHILDFGMAQMRENFTYSLHKLTLKDPGPMMGDPRYLSPEQAAGLKGDSLDSRSDIYSLGIIFYQLLAGQLPAPSASPLQSLMWHAMGTPPDLRESFPDFEIPEELNELVRQMLVRPREKRLQDARTLIQRLELFDAKHNPVPAKAIESPSFSLLSDRSRPKPADKSLDMPVPKAKPQVEAKQPVGATKLPPTPAVSAIILPVGAVEITPVQSYVASAIKPPPLQRRSQRGWGIAASLLIVVGVGTAGYHFRNRIPWIAGQTSGAGGLQVWGQELESAVHASTQKMEEGLQGWSQKVESQLSSPRPNPASPAVHPRTPASPPPVVAQSSNAPEETRPAAARDNVPAANSAKLPKPVIESRGKLAANGSSRAAESNATTAKPEQRPRQEANAGVKKPSTPIQLDSTAMARMIDTDLRNGDSLFEAGQYDQAISNYKEALVLAPTNKVLLDRIARARRAQAAEAEYLNQ